MRVANFITFFRMFGAFVVPLFLVLDLPRVFVFFTYIFFALTDIVDGYISRASKEKEKTDGDIFDPVADKMLFISTLVVLVGIQDIPKMTSSIIILREILVLGLRASAERHKFHIQSTPSAKLKTLSGNIAVSSYILKEEYFGISAKFVGDIFLVLCFALAVISGAEYVTKYIRHIKKSGSNKD